jgi:uncharacterized protein Veg
MFCKSDIDNLKTDMKSQIGQKIMIKGTLGRSRVYEKVGTIQNVYSNLFVVKCDEEEGNTSFNFTDVLTKSVEVSVFDGNNYQPLKIPIFDEKKNKKMVNV